MMSIQQRQNSIKAVLVLWMLVHVGLVQAQGFPGHRDALGDQFDAAPKATAATPPILGSDRPTNTPAQRLLFWSEIANNASGIDHTPLVPGETRVFGEQFGPTRASRAMGIVHIAMFDAVNAISGGFESYGGLRRATGAVSVDAAIAQSARDSLVALFPSQGASINNVFRQDLQRIPNSDAKQTGIALGQQAAAAILALRANDGSAHVEPLIGNPNNSPLNWQQDPISQSPIALGELWAGVKPFAMTSASQFRTPLPPDRKSAAYLAAFDEVKRLGGDGTVTPTQRTLEQTQIGIFWAYDGTPSLCAPTRLYNQITVRIAERRTTDVAQLARLLALVNTAMADSGIASWESKYFYRFWRPVTGIRAPSTGPTRDRNFTPLGAPASNLNGPNFTPPFPSYPSGHATFGGTLFQTLRNFYGTDAISFTFVSDEFNGVTTDNLGVVRALLPRSFATLSEAEEENGQSRIYLGIHWAFDKTEGIIQGRNVANHVFATRFRPTPN